MNVSTITWGICATCLIACLLVAGCLNQSTPGSTEPATTPQPAVTPQPENTVAQQPAGAGPAVTVTPEESLPATPDTGGFVYSSDETPAPDESQVTMAPDVPAVPSNAVPQQTLTQDHDDMGDILP